MFKPAERQFTFEDAQNLCGGLLTKDSFYSILGEHGHRWIIDEDYASMYKANVGRGCVAPSLLVRALFLQNYRACSDRELVERIRFDLRYKVALGVKVDYEGFHPSLLSIFRARLLLHSKEGAAFELSVQLAKESGLVAGLYQAVDSMPTKGAAAAQDTYTLIRTALEKLLEAIRKQREKWEGSRGFQYPFSNKRYPKGGGKPKIDWGDENARQKYLDELIGDAASLLEAIAACPDLAKSELVTPMVDLLTKILAQDIECTDGQNKINRNTSDRIISTNDPEARHGRKSSCRLIKGYKTHVIVTPDEIVTSVAVTAANAADSAPVSKMVEDLDGRQAKSEQLYGDCAYGGADLRAELRTAGVEMVAKLPRLDTETFQKRDFKIDVEEKTVTCPAGLTVTESRMVKDAQKRLVPLFVFQEEQCGPCELRAQCLTEKMKCRKIQLHYNESELQAAQEKASAPDFREDIKKRLVVERVQGRLQSYGLKCSRYFGLEKTRLQALFTAAVNNLYRTVTRGPTLGVCAPQQEAT